MIYTIEYKDNSDREQVKAEYAHLLLVEERNISEGNFLIFSDLELVQDIIYTTVPSKEIDTLMTSNTETAEYLIDLDFRLSSIELGL
ncbi:hypothetical protein [Domibacillus iocasae]|uniref:Uncharacterized protein n=1 Tax=Domibacillus iocasae TaxID=1714016 RepID=A0A1E7DRA3_9BACI|nr:hypothetical protein [Domibacillus iocasae]OES45218.1 hypothetical protein BA724_04210 [Domibacillus iocasae]